MPRFESIYTKDISKVTFADVKEFYDLKIRESLRVDYKKDFPSELERIVASFANTAGGIILLGVDTDDANKPSQIVGIQYVKGLEEKVLNICHSNSSPPITPEVIVCPYSSTNTDCFDRCVIVVRVRESSDAPHFIGKRRNMIYIRIDNESEQADAESIKQLMEKREKGEQRTKAFLDSRKLSSPFPIELSGTPEFPNWFTTQVIVIPSSITRALIEFTEEADKFLSDLPCVRELARHGTENPKQNGIDWSFESELSKLFAEVTVSGLVLYKQAINTGNRIHYPQIITNIFNALDFALAVYEKFGFTGKVIVRVDLTGTKQRELVLGGAPNLRLSSYVAVGGYVTVEKQIDVDELAVDSTSFVAWMFLDLARAFRWSMSREEANAIVKAVRKS